MQSVRRFRSELLHFSRYKYTPISNFKIQNKVNPVIAVTIGNNKDAPIELHFRLFQNVVPKTTQNFKRLLLGTAVYQGRPLSLIGNHFHRVMSRNFAEIGHLNGGNCSIFGPTFRDQSFELVHDRPGLLTSISQENSNNSRFSITYAPCPFLDYKNVIFGELTAETFPHLKVLEKLGSKLTQYQILATKQLEQQPHNDHDHDAHH